MSTIPTRNDAHTRARKTTMDVTWATILSLLLLLGTGACGVDTNHVDHDGEEHAHAEHGDEEGAIVLTPAAMNEAGITVEEVLLQPISAGVTAPGRVVPTQQGLARVGTTIPGRVSRLYVSEGTYVGKGAALAEIESMEIGEMKGAVASARARIEQARKAVARQERLVAENIGARRNLEEARSALAQSTADLRAAEGRLRSAGINPSSVGSGAYSSRVTLRSPISGVVARQAVALGQYLDPDHDAFEIVNTSSVWVDAQVPPKVAHALKVGGVGFVRDQDDHRHSGRIRFIAPVVDPTSRTVTVRTELTNPDVHLRPESFVTMEFERSVSGHAVAVPKTAIELTGGEAFVYRQEEPGHFARVPVELGQESGDRRVVTAGLKEGDRVAVSGLFYLKSARQKGELREHSH